MIGRQLEQQQDSCENIGFNNVHDAHAKSVTKYIYKLYFSVVLYTFGICYKVTIYQKLKQSGQLNYEQLVYGFVYLWHIENIAIANNTAKA